MADSQRKPQHPLTMDSNLAFLNKFGPLIFMAAHLSTGIYGLFYAMPTLYQSPTVLLIMQVLGCFGLGQVIICWSLARKIDSSYLPKHPFSIPKQVPGQLLMNGDSSLSEEKSETIEDITLSIPSGYTHQSEQGCQNAMSVKINIATSVNGIKGKKFFPYWSWTPCFTCHFVRPPRCHHCPLCQKCILKRDHHCFFTGTCIGVKNQGHFIVFMFWAVFATLFGTCHMLPYTYLEILPAISYFDFLPPIAVTRVVFGYIHFSVPFLCFLFWVLLILTILSIVVFYDIINVTMRGATTFELEKKVKVIDCRSLSDRWNDVLGRRWLLSFLIPFRVLVEGQEDALIWPHIKL